MKKLTKQLFILLSIHSPSGKEWGVGKYLLPILKDTMDHVFFDEFGNLYAEKSYGTSPYTVLLNAHMDTVARTQPIPKWRKNKTEIYNAAPDATALGGDDKCGIAAHLAVIRQLNRSTNFRGTLKVCFTRQEEVGCVGASQAVRLKTEWFKDINASIVVDRRGGDHIITGGFSERFCSDEYTKFWEEMAQKVGFIGTPQDGTISDTMVFAEMGINSVNLSAGYYEAHSSKEYIKIEELKRVVNWITQAIDHIEDYTFPSFKYELPRSPSKHLYQSAWMQWGRDAEPHDDTLSYCEGCGDLCESSELSFDADSGEYLCFDCSDSLFYDYCSLCDALHPLDNLVEWRGHTLCHGCCTKLEEGIV